MEEQRVSSGHDDGQAAVGPDVPAQFVKILLDASERGREIQRKQGDLHGELPHLLAQAGQMATDKTLSCRQMDTTDDIPWFPGLGFPPLYNILMTDRTLHILLQFSETSTDFKFNFLYLVDTL